MNKLEKAIFNRTELLLGADVMQALSEVRVILFGVGGVGSWCAEGLVRSGVKHLTIVDSDRVSITNVNRQLMATTKTVGQVKVEALKNHLLEINPNAEIEAIQAIYCEDTADRFDLDSYDYVVDAVDSLKDKALLILKATASRAKFYCSLGAALKTNPLKVQVAEFWDVRGCPLGAALRKKMKRAGTFPAHKFLCVYDDEVWRTVGRTVSVRWRTVLAMFRRSAVRIVLARLVFMRTVVMMAVLARLKIVLKAFARAPVRIRPVLSRRAAPAIRLS